MHDLMNPTLEYLLILCSRCMNRFKEAIHSFSYALIFAEKLLKSKEFQNNIVVQLFYAMKNHWEENRNYSLEKHLDSKLNFRKLEQRPTLLESQGRIDKRIRMTII